MIYGNDLAHIHHAGFDSGARAAAQALLDELREAGFTSGLVVDLGCGTGILARAVVDAGFDALGVDISPSMITQARIHAPQGRFVVASLHEFEIPECVAVSAVGEGLGYLAPGEDAVDLDPVFTRVWRALVPGGLLLFDVVESSTGDPMSYSISRSGPDWEVTAEVSEDPARSVLTRTITTRRREHQTERSSREVHRVQTFWSEDLERLLVRCGFLVEIADSYREVALPARRIGVVARKPRT